MGFRGILIVGLMGFLAIASLAYPFAGIASYLIHYHVHPERAWWGASLAASGLRFSFTIVICLALGTLLNWNRLQFRWLLGRQEVLFLCFLAWMTISQLAHGTLVSSEGGTTDTVEKMLKMSVFLLIMTHVVTTEQLFDRLMQILVLCALYVGYEAYNAPASYYFQGRLNGGVGGPDFAEANSLGAHCVFLTIIVSVSILRNNRWRDVILGLIAGAFIANTVILTRSRGAFLGAAVGLLVAIFFAPSGRRGAVWAFVLVGLAVISTRIDSGFWERMGTMEANTEHQADRSAQERLETWQATLHMIADHPLGVGPNNFGARFGEYIPRLANRDTHNSYLRCAAELGLPGLIVFGLLIANALWSLVRMIRDTTPDSALAGCRWHAYALLVALVSYLVAAIFGSYTYLETMWLLLMLPASLERTIANARSANSVPGPYSVADSGLDDGRSQHNVLEITEADWDATEHGRLYRP